jgi:peptide/nickel transport system ATP-binding protein
LFTAPRHPYTRKLLSSFPNIRADRRTLDVIPGSPPDLRRPPAGCRFAERCPDVMDVCRQEVPVEVQFPDGVRVACHHFPPGGDGVALPTPAAWAAPTRKGTRS